MSTEAPASNASQAPETAAGAAARVQASRAALRAELAAGVGTPDAKPAAAAKADEPKGEPPALPEPAEPDADEAEDDSAAAGESDAAPSAEAKPDADTAKRLAAVQREETRARAKLAKEREEIVAERAAAAKERAELEADRKALAEFRRAQERAKVDPVAYLRAAGVPDAELEDAARQVYAAAKGNPANKAEAARTLREKELAAEVAELKKWREERTQAETTQAEMASARAAADAYVADLTKAAAAGEASPLAKHFLAKNPQRTEAALRRITWELLQETGDKPDHEDVLARFEKQRRAELEEFGIDPTTLSTAKTDQKKPDPVAAKKPAAKTLGNDLSTPRVPRPRSSERELRAEVRAQLESGKLEL
jgi:hypothetical protein